MHVPVDSTHCEDCDLCVQSRDHHCMIDYYSLLIGFWIGKCVGAKNMAHFSNFCLSVVVYYCYMIFTRIPIVFNFIEDLYKWFVYELRVSTNNPYYSMDTRDESKPIWLLLHISEVRTSDYDNRCSVITDYHEWWDDSYHHYLKDE